MANTFQSQFTGLQMDERFAAVPTLQSNVTALLAAVANTYTKEQVDAITAAIAAAVNATSGVTAAELPTASADTVGKIYYIGPTNGEYARYVTAYDGSTYSWLSLGTTAIDLTQYATAAEFSQLEQEIHGGSEEEEVNMIADLDLSWKDGYGFAWETGSNRSSSANTCTETYVPIPAGATKIKYLSNTTTGTTGTYGPCLYDASKNFIGGLPPIFNAPETGTAENIVNVPEGAAFIRFTVFQTGKASFYAKAIVMASVEGLAEKVEGKIDKSSIADNLETNDTSKVLSAAQGYQLGQLLGTFEKTMVPTFNWQQGGINTSGAEPSSGSDYNNRIKSGTYFPSTGEAIEMNAKTGYSYRLYRYASDGTFESYITEYTGKNTYQTVDGKLYRFVLLRTAGGAITPEEAGDARFTVAGFDLDASTGHQAFLTPLYESTTKVDLAGKTIAFIGDSITNGNSATSDALAFPALVAARYGATARILAYNGACVANNTENNLAAHRLVTFATAENLGDVALVVVFGGTNDFSYDSKAIGDLFVEETITPNLYVGDKQISAPADTDAFGGAFHELLSTIRANANGAPVVCMTPLHRDNVTSGHPTDKQSNSNGDFLTDFADAIKKIAPFYACAVLDLYESNLMPGSYIQGFNADHVHPNDKGHRIIAELLFRFIEQNIVI